MKRISALSLVLLLLLLLCSTASAAERWHWIGSNETGLYYFSVDDIKYAPNHDHGIDKNIIQFVTIHELSAEGVTALSDQMKRYNNNRIEWNRVSYIMNFEAINIRDRSLRTYTTIFFDEGRHILYKQYWRVSNNYSNWKDIRPSTINDLAYQHVIAYAGKHDKDMEKRQ